ncbi:unnamed protein product [Arabidopsis lyrata]|nr:unnamed protein product [Arabidopsis lyrata]
MSPSYPEYLSGATSAAAGYGTAYHLFEVDEMELVKERQKVETNKQEALK